MAKQGAVRVSITADSSDLVRETRKSEAALGRLGKSGSKSMGLLGAGAGLAAGAIGAGLTAAVIDSVKAASNLEEQINKTRVVFRGSEKDILQWSKSTSTALGISRREALESAGVFGNMLVPMGIARKQAGDMSVRFVKLAADMASFNNASPADTLAALRSGLSGEQEPLRRFGVFLNEANVKQEALKEGFRLHNGALSDAAKAQARYNLILKQSGDAQGDFARTSSGAANQQRILKAQVEDLEAAIGKQLLPVFRDALGWLNKFITEMRTGKGVGGDFADIMVQIGKAVKTTATVLIWWWDKLIKFGRVYIQIWRTVGKVFGDVMAGILRGFGKLFDAAAKLPVVGGKFKGLGDKARAAADDVDKFGEKAKKTKSVLEGLTSRTWPVNVDLKIGATSGIPGFKPLKPLNQLQRGGLIPGFGNGDTVPVMAEPGEGFINKKAVQALGGERAIDHINRMVPRFQGGGTVDPWRVRPNANRGTAQVVKNNLGRLNQMFGGIGGPGAKGVGTFDGQPVANWIIPYLTYGRQHGWSGGVTSGFRTFAEQTAIWNSGVRPAARPGTSNHEGSAYPRGAVDVSDAATLAQVLALRPGPHLLQWAGAKDPVHFSHPHGGSYQLGGMVPRFQRGGTITQAGSRGKEYHRLIQMASSRTGVPAHILAGLIDVESKWNPSAVSPAGARGLTQFMPGTAPGYGVRYGTDHTAVWSQILGAGKYLVALGWGSDPKRALAAYNGGPGNPQYGYADDVLAASSGYRGAFAAGSGGAGGKKKVTEDSKRWNWTKMGNRKRGIFVRGRRKPLIVDSERFARLAGQGKIDWGRTKHMRGDPATRRSLTFKQSQARFGRRIAAGGADLWTGAFSAQMDNALALAELTPGLGDDRAAQVKALQGWLGFLDTGKRTGNQSLITSSAQGVKGAIDAIKSIDEELKGGAGGGNSLADALTELAESNKELKATLADRNAYWKSIEHTDKEVAVQVLADVISGQIGGQTAQRRRSAGDGVTVARY